MLGFLSCHLGGRICVSNFWSWFVEARISTQFVDSCAHFKVWVHIITHFMTVCTRTFQLQFQHTHSKRSFQSHISSQVHQFKKSLQVSTKPTPEPAAATLVSSPAMVTKIVGTPWTLTKNVAVTYKSITKDGNNSLKILQITRKTSMIQHITHALPTQTECLIFY